MQTFESIRHDYPVSHRYLIEKLLNHGLTFLGSVNRNGERFTTIEATCGEITIASDGAIVFSTENTNPYEQNDCGYHSWFISDDNIEDAEMLGSFILRTTGDD